MCAWAIDAGCTGTHFVRAQSFGVYKWLPFLSLRFVYAIKPIPIICWIANWFVIYFPNIEQSEGVCPSDVAECVCARSVYYCFSWYWQFFIHSNHFHTHIQYIYEQNVYEPLNPRIIHNIFLFVVAYFMARLQTHYNIDICFNIFNFHADCAHLFGRKSVSVSVFAVLLLILTTCICNLMRFFVLEPMKPNPQVFQTMNERSWDDEPNVSF